MFFNYFSVISHEVISASLRKPCGFFPWFLMRIPLILLLKILKDKAYEIDRNHGYDGYQRALAASMVYKFFDKKIGSGPIASSKAEINVNK